MKFTLANQLCERTILLHRTQSSHFYLFILEKKKINEIKILSFIDFGDNTQLKKDVSGDNAKFLCICIT